MEWTVVGRALLPVQSLAIHAVKHAFYTKPFDLERVTVGLRLYDLMDRAFVLNVEITTRVDFESMFGRAGVPILRMDCRRTGTSARPIFGNSCCQTRILYQAIRS
jgi:hypothetical protein